MKESDVSVYVYAYEYVLSFYCNIYMPQTIIYIEYAMLCQAILCYAIMSSYQPMQWIPRSHAGSWPKVSYPNSPKKMLAGSRQKKLRSRILCGDHFLHLAFLAWYRKKLIGHMIFRNIVRLGNTPSKLIRQSIDFKSY